MRKLVSAFLIFLYILPAIGFSIGIHRCGNKVKVITIDSPHEKKCPCSKKMPSGCCKDVHLSLKLTDNHKTATQLAVPNNNFVKQLSVIASFETLNPISQVTLFDFTYYYAPPFKSKQPVYLANSIFRI